MRSLRSAIRTSGSFRSFRGKSDKENSENSEDSEERGDGFNMMDCYEGEMVQAQVAV